MTNILLILTAALLAANLCVSLLVRDRDIKSLEETVDLHSSILKSLVKAVRALNDLVIEGNGAHKGEADEADKAKDDEQRRYEEGIANILAYGLDNAHKRPGDVK